MNTTTATLLLLLANFIGGGLMMAVAIGFGYWMGKRSIIFTEQPVMRIDTAAPPDQGPGDEPEGGDIFAEAMEGSEDTRMSTGL
jgi:hypothetical protein